MPSIAGSTDVSQGQLTVNVVNQGCCSGQFTCFCPDPGQALNKDGSDDDDDDDDDDDGDDDPDLVPAGAVDDDPFDDLHIGVTT